MTSTFRNHSKLGQIFSENIDDLIFVLNEKYQCEYNNFQKFTIKKKLNDYVHPQDFNRVSKLLKEIFKIGYGSEEAQIKYNGKPFRWFEIKGKSFIDNEDNRKKAFLICRDINKFKKFEFDLKKSQASFDEITDSLPEIQFWRLLQSRKGINVVQKTTEMLELVFDNIPQLIYWKDTNLIYMGCNKNFTLLNKIKEPTSIIGRKDEDLIWIKDNLNSFIDKEHEIIRNDKPEYNAIESLNIIEGKQSWFEINRIPLHDSKGNVVGILVTYEDITIRKIGEQKLKESEEKYRGILENIRETYFEVDLKGNFTFFNDSFLDLIGFSKSELLSINYRNFVDEENKNKIFRVYSEVYQTSQPKSNFQYQFRKKNGELVTCESSVYLRYDSEGNKIGFSGLARDITEKYILEQKIKESEEKYRTIFNSSPDYIFITDTKGYILDMNPALLERVGMKLKQAIGTNFTDYLASDNIKELQEVGAAIEAGREIKGVEIKAKTTRGEIFEYEVNAVPLKENGKVTKILNLARDITLRKLTEQKLRESEKKYRHLFENASYSIILINRNGVIIDCNPATEKIFKKKIEDLININFLDVSIKPEKLLPLFKQRYQSILNGIIPEPLEIQISRSKDHHLMWISIDDSFVEIGGENIFQVIIQDITEKKMAEQELKKSQEELTILNRELEQKVLERTKDLIESEQQYRTTINSLNDPLHVVNKDLKIILANNAFNHWLADLGIDKQIVSRTVFEAFPFLPDKVLEEYEEVFNTGEILLTEGSIFLNEKEIFTETRKIPIFSEGNVSQVITIIRDITESKKMEIQLKESEENFRNMITNLDEGYYKVEWEGNLIYHNPTYTKIAGYDLNENKIEQPQPFFWEDPIDREEYIRKLLKDGFIRNFIVPIKKKDGTIIVVQINAHLIRDDNNKPVAIEGTFSDITDKFRLEQELLESEKILRQQNIELKKLDKVKNDFITMAAHELKTPLISISGYTDYILMKHRSHLNPEVTTDLLIVQRNVNRLEILMDQLLDVMKIDENKLKLQKELVNVSKIINNCLDELSYLINEKNLEIILNIEHEIILDVDPTRIFTVFTNLLSNAIKFTPDYGWVEISSTKKDNDYIFKVKDNGVGLAQDEIGRLFRKFERFRPPLLDHYVNIKDSGTGLGLYITKGIINSHGGNIWANSKGPNKGSLFSFSLPI
ncbi:MAG: PAS domain S-box protein [Candidatus Lokiarchaeota archaeon]|nr:PAS domain S-box protein [Candidatus Lokiarchaeota archaeon]